MNREVVNAINLYYKLKQKYMNEGKKKKKAVKTSNLTIQDKRTKLKQITDRQPCIKCKNPGGTLFFRKKSHIKAICNCDIKCDLNIDILVGGYYDLNKTISIALDDEQEAKTNITKLKMDVFYGFKDETTVEEEFSNLAEEFSDSVLTKNYWQNELFSIIKNDETEKQKENLEINIATLIQQIKETTNNKEIAKIYASNLRPLLDEYNNTFFNQHFVEYDDSNDTHNLVREEFTIRELEASLDDDAEIISMVK